MTYTARFEKIPHIVHVTLPDASAYDIVYEGDTTLAYGDTFAFTLRLKPGYQKSDAFQVTAQGQVLQSDASGVYRFRVFADTAIRIETQTDSVQSGTFVPTFSLYLWSGIISALALFMTVKKRRKS